jgi:hypothetical protein
MKIFYDATIITLGNGQKTPFWHAHWLEGRMLKDITPKKFDLCKKKKGWWRKCFMTMSGLGNIAPRLLFQ